MFDELLDEDVDFVEVVDVVVLTESTSIAFSTQSRPVRGIRAGFRGGSGRWHFGMGGGPVPPRSFCCYPRNGRRKLAQFFDLECLTEPFLSDSSADETGGDAVEGCEDVGTPLITDGNAMPAGTRHPLNDMHTVV